MAWRVPWVGLPAVWLRTGALGLLAAVGALLMALSLLSVAYQRVEPHPRSSTAQPVARRRTRLLAGRWSGGTALVAGLLALALVVDPRSAYAAFTSTTTNAGNSLSSAQYYSCHSAVRDIGGGGITGSSPASRYYKLDETAGPTAADSSGSAAHGTYYGGVTFSAAGPCPRDGAKAVTLNGSTGYIGTSAPVASPTVFSLEIWFRTTTTRGGMIMNLATTTSGASTVTGNSSDPDKGLYMTDTGRLAFSVRSGVNATAISPAPSYNDGQWHLVTVTMSSSAGARMYVDGALAASNAGMTISNSYTGYWRIGYDTVPGSWPFGPTSTAFAGTVAHASTYAMALTAAQVADHYEAGI
jgi:hypothetical protein